jgi:hypothetical protein
MMARSQAFHRAALERLRSPMFIDHKQACWLAPLDPLEKPCGGGWKWEAFHFIGRQAIRKSPTLWGVDPELLILAEWDPRNGGPGCVDHHRRFDSHATPELVVCHETLPPDVQDFIADWGLEPEAERKFPIAPLSPL